MRVTDVDVSATDNGVRLSALVRWERASSACDHLEYTYRGVEASAVRTPGDALAAAVLFPAMAHGEDVVIDAPVSRSLLANIDAIVATWKKWRRRWHPTRVSAPEVDRSGLSPTEVAALFSGGIDSFYTLLMPRDEPITTLISMTGYSTLAHVVPGTLGDRLTSAATRLGFRHVVVETNVWPWATGYVPRTARFGTPHHGAALLSMALGLGAVVRRCYIASSEPFPDRPWGSHPDLDPLWSTETLEVVHDAPELSRTQKFRVVAESDVALDTLRVCNTSSENCRRCDKCQAAALMLHIAGALDRSKTLGPVTPETIRRIRIGIWHRHVWADLRRQVEEPDLKRAIGFALLKAHAKRPARPLGHVLRRVGLR